MAVRRVDANRTVGINIYVEPEVADLIDQRIGYTGSQQGIESGRTAWLRAMIYEALGVRPQPYRDRQKEAITEACAASCEKWLAQPGLSSSQRRVLELRMEGLGIQEIARVLIDEGFPTIRGGRWSAEHIRKMLGRLGIP